MNPEIEQLKKQIEQLSSRIEEIAVIANKNNFSSTQTFNKACVFGDRLRVPVFGSAPTVAELGDVFCLSDGNLYVCTVGSSTSPTWTLVGSQ